MKKFCILIPTINRYDLLKEALAEYPTLYPNVDIYVGDSGRQGIENNHPIKLFQSNHPLGVSASWNNLISRAIEDGYDYFLILNDDIILRCGKNAIEKLIDQFNEGVFVRPKPFYHWCAFILNRWIFEKVGRFDENFKKCFFEDNDYEYRMKLAGIKIEYSEVLSPEVFRNSMSTQKDPLLGDYVGNKEYYIRKWGGEPNSEKYILPFGGNTVF